MNIRDSYIHGKDGKGVVKRLFFATAADVANDSNLHVNDLVYQLADTFETVIALTIPTLNQNTTGSAGSLKVVKRSTNANHYLTFVDSNNDNATAENFYTDGDIKYNPSTNILTVPGLTVSASSGFNYSGIETATSNSARPVWFAYSGRNGTPCVNTSFTYNPSTDVLKVGALDGPAIIIGDTTLYINHSGTTNKLTPDTLINADSTHGTIPSSAAVWNAILNGMKANDAMIFKGFLEGGSSAANTAYTPAAETGYTYKVKTAGYINGTYYQVNDTFICTEDNTAAATSSNVATVKTKWGVVEGNGDFLSINGGTMYGTLKWANTTALPASTTAPYILVVDATANGTTKYITLANMRTQLIDSLYWANVKVSNASSTSTEPQFAKVGIAGAKDGTAKLKVYGNEIVTGNLTIGGCTLVYDSSTPCLKFTF